MKKLYPLKFKTIFKEKIWGGAKLKSELNKNFSPLPNCGETWELSGVENNISIVKDGELKGKSLVELIETYKEQLVGNSIYQQYGKEFPLLIKFIDANQDLSIQVHPDDKLAKERHNCLGKTEMWYIMQSDEGAKLVSGFNKELNKQEYLEKFKNKKLSTLLNYEKAMVDDVFYIPAGRIHTIGKGILLAEIQQTSDITYRIYDFDRKGVNGNLRELHTEEAVDAINYQFHENYKLKYTTTLNKLNTLIKAKYFTANKLHFNCEKERNYNSLDSFVIYICLEGEISISCKNDKVILKKGDVILLPASINNAILKPFSEAKILEVYV